MNRMRRLGYCLSAIGIAAILLASRLTAAEPTAPTSAKQAAARQGEQPKVQYIRLVRDERKRPLAMETAIVRFVPAGENADGLTVDLISAVHVGEKAYYDALNKQFEQYDALLYELVAPEGTRVPKGGGESRHPLGAMQSGLKNLLELEYQLAGIDYHKDNFVHADMSPEEFAKSMQERGESFWSIMFRMLGYGIAQQSKSPSGSSDVDLLLALFDKNRALRLKQILAEQFQDLDMLTAAFGGSEGSTIITERNKAALRVLRREIDGGKKRIGIFYGAGHMPDFEQRLREEFGLKPTEVTWLEAWNLREAGSR